MKVEFFRLRNHEENGKDFVYFKNSTCCFTETAMRITDDYKISNLFLILESYY